MDLKVHKNENFFGFNFDFLLFHCLLGINNKIMGKNFFDWTIMGGATIKTRRNKKIVKIGQIFFLNHI